MWCERGIEPYALVVPQLFTLHTYKLLCCGSRGRQGWGGEGGCEADPRVNIGGCASLVLGSSIHTGGQGKRSAVLRLRDCRDGETTAPIHDSIPKS